MSDGVNRLKELLFDTEVRRLDELNRRFQSLADSESVRHGELARRVDVVFERAGSADRMQKSVAAVIDGALREAEVDRHDSLSRAVAPLVVSTIKYELKNSQDEMVDALYPITGRLVKQYVTTAVNDMMIKINADLARKMPGARLAMRLKSMTSGVTMGELAFANAQKFEVDELFLVRRGTGEMVAHWDRLAPTSSTSLIQSNRGALVPSYLAAMTAFAEEAFDANKASLRTLDMGDARVFVRSSPAYLLAAKCAGRGAAAVEQVIDDQFLAMLDTHHTVFAQDTAGMTDIAARDKAAAEVAKTLPAFARDLDAKLAAAAQSASGPAVIDFTPLYMLAGLILIPLVAIGGWIGWQSYLTQRTEVATQSVLTASPDFNGFPVQLQVERGGRTVTVSGLAPSNSARTAFVGRLNGAVENLVVRDRLGVLPDAGQPVDMRPFETTLQRVASEATLAPIRRALGRVETRVSDMLRMIDTLLSAPALATLDRDRLARGRVLLTEAAAQVPSLRQQLGSAPQATALSAPFGQLHATLLSAETEIGGLAGRSPSTASGAPSAARANAVAAVDPATPAEDAAFTAERLVTILMTIKPIEQRVGVLSDKIDALRSPEPDARQKLIVWTRTNAVFFYNGPDFLDADKANATLDELTNLLSSTSGVLRVVGYTDERGGANINTGLAVSRAEKVVSALVSRGLPRDRLITVGRTTGPDLTPAVGPGSANRRVEFEVGFVGEAGSSSGPLR
jgi:outer membrane protein OmpA-like peptidoglycan-associated protein